MSNKNKILRKPVQHEIEPVSDDGIKFLIHQAFRWRVRANRIRVTAQNGVVKLRGSLPSFEELQKAEQAVRETRGVKRIENYLKIEH